MSAGKLFWAVFGGVVLALLVGLGVFFGGRWLWQRHEGQVNTQRQQAAANLSKEKSQACIASIYFDSVSLAESQGVSGATNADVNRAYQIMLNDIAKVPEWKSAQNANPSGEGLIRIDNYCRGAGFNQARYKWPSRVQGE